VTQSLYIVVIVGHYAKPSDHITPWLTNQNQVIQRAM